MFELDPQLPSTEMAPRLVSEAAAVVEVFLVAVVAVVAAVAVEDSSSDSQVPNSLWHPVPQYVEPLPQ
jgi:hypothetical protein